MDQAISSTIGAILFIWFTAGLAESIGSIPFFLIVVGVIAMVGYSTWEVIMEAFKPNGSHKPSK